MITIIYNPNNKDIAYYRGEIVPKHIAGRRHEIYAKVKMGIPLTKPEYDIYVKHIAKTVK